MLLPEQTHESRDDEFRMAVMHAIFREGQVQLIAMEDQPQPELMDRVRVKDLVHVLKPDGTFMAEFQVTSKQSFDQEHPDTKQPMKGTAVVMALNPKRVPALRTPKDLVELLGGEFPVLEKNVNATPGLRRVE